MSALVRECKLSLGTAHEPCKGFGFVFGNIYAEDLSETLAQHLHYRRDSELLYADVLYADDLKAGVKSLSQKGSWDNVFAYLGRDIVKSCVQEVGASLVNNN